MDELVVDVGQMIFEVRDHDADDEFSGGALQLKGNDQTQTSCYQVVLHDLAQEHDDASFF